MRRKSQTDAPHEHNRLTRLIDWLVSAFLFISLLGLFGTVFRKLFGTSDIAWLIGLLVCTPLAGIAYNIIDKAFPAFMILLLFALPAVVLLLIFLLM